MVGEKLVRCVEQREGRREYGKEGKNMSRGGGEGLRVGGREIVRERSLLVGEEEEDARREGIWQRKGGGELVEVMCGKDGMCQGEGDVCVGAGGQ